MKLRCLIVDDEPLARRVLEKHISALPSLNLIKQCASAVEAAAYLHEHPVDVMFLDIKMPELTGLEFLKTLLEPPQVILTTAYSEYALEGYEYSVVDYLLKPISFERFLKAVNKLHDRNGGQREADHIPKSSHQDGFLFLRADKTDHKVRFSEIRYVEGCGNYVKVFLENKMLMIAETLTHVENNLPKGLFVRVHKSFIIALDRIDQVEGNLIRIGDAAIPVGATYRREVKHILERHQLIR